MSALGGHVVSLLLCILFSSSTHSNDNVCVKSTPCLCKFSDEKFIDVSHVVTKDTPFLISVNNNVSYYFHPCKDVNFTSPLFNETLAVNNCAKGTSLCMYNKTANSTTDLGSSENVIFSADYPVSLVFSSPDKTSSLITLMCTPDGKESFLYSTSKDKFSHAFILFSPHACVQSVPDSLSVGSTLLILFSTGLGVYLIGGILVMRLLRGARGKEMIPNLDFWVGLPSLIRDGFIFLLNGCNPVSVPTAETYDRI